MGAPQAEQAARISAAAIRGIVLGAHDIFTLIFGAGHNIPFVRAVTANTWISWPVAHLRSTVALSSLIGSIQQGIVSGRGKRSRASSPAARSRWQLAARRPIDGVRDPCKPREPECATTSRGLESGLAVLNPFHHRFQHIPMRLPQKRENQSEENQCVDVVPSVRSHHLRLSKPQEVASERCCQTILLEAQALRRRSETQISTRMCNLSCGEGTCRNKRSQRSRHALGGAVPTKN